MQARQYRTLTLFNVGGGISLMRKVDIDPFAIALRNLIENALDSWGSRYAGFRRDHAGWYCCRGWHIGVQVASAWPGRWI